MPVRPSDISMSRTLCARSARTLLGHTKTLSRTGRIMQRTGSRSHSLISPAVQYPRQPITIPSAIGTLPRVEPIDTESRETTLKDASPFSDFLTDKFSRQHDYLRISVTERCNLRCLYCMPEEGVPLSPPAHLLTSQEIFYLSSIFVSQGVSKIRLTGGEPTVRRDILPLMHSIGSLRARGLRELCLTTNGITLFRKLDSMAEAGVTGINLSLDTLDPFQFQIMTRRNGFDAVTKSMDRILEMNRLGAAIKLKINCVVMRGLNEKEIIPFVELGREKDVEVRFIEYMPFDGNKWNQKKMISYQEMLGIIRDRYPGVRKVRDHKNDTSKTYQVPGFEGKLGFITSMTHNFCGTCNRLRITSDGNLKVCLFGNTEFSLRDLIRKDNEGQPLDDEALERLRSLDREQAEELSISPEALQSPSRESELLQLIGLAVKRKKRQHAGMGNLENMKNRPMILIGKLVKELVAIGKAYADYAQASSFNQTDALTLPPKDQRPSSVPLKRGLPMITSALADVPSLEIPPLLRVPHLRPHLPELRPAVKNEKVASLLRSLSTKPENAPKTLTHLTPAGNVHMVDIGAKHTTSRVAVAVGEVIFSNAAPLPLIRTAAAKKGDVLAIARIAGIMAAKRTSDLIPLCHPIELTAIEVDLELLDDDSKGEGSSSRRFGRVRVRAQVECQGKTGVEMEALTAVMGACLTVVDMCKAVDRGMRVEDVKVIFKDGGRSGQWRRNCDEDAET